MDLAYKEYGICGLRLNYKGRKSYLSDEQQQEVLSWLQTKEIWELGELEFSNLTGQAYAIETLSASQLMSLYHQPIGETTLV